MIYSGRVCEKYHIGICFSGWKLLSDEYLFSNTPLMKELDDAGMVMSVEVKP